MVLSDNEIRELSCNNKKLHLEKSLIFPFDEKKLQSASYDLCMTNEIYVFKQQVKTINLINQNEIDEIYEKIDMSENGYVLQPGGYILIEVDETICLPADLTAHIRPRTRFTRLGITVSAQHCNPTYRGKLRLGLHNVSPNAIILAAGLCVAQIIFEELTSTPSEDKWYQNKKDSIYQNEASFIGAKFGKEELSPKAQELYQLLIDASDKEG